MARCGHKKSRNGCSRCKQRKVKCDEKRPCSACTRQEAVCSLSQASGVDAVVFSSDKHAEADLRPNAQRGDDYRVSSTPTNRFLPPAHRLITFSENLTKPSTRLTHGLQDGWAVDLGLMSHYSCYTAATLPGASCHTWQSAVPKEAVSYPFLMHQILAVSAFHLSTLLQPTQHQSYIAKAFHHQHQMICGVQAEITHINSENCHALFAASSLLFIGAFAASVDVANSSRRGALGDILDIFTLIRGVNGILESSKDMVRQGVLGDFMQCDLPSGRSALLSLLLEKLPLITGGSSWEDMNPKTKHLAAEALASLRGSVGVSSAAPPELNVAICWPMSLQNGFMALLRVYHPAALVILAHYCVILDAAGLQYWFMRDWGRRLFSSIKVALVPAWHESIRWPIEYFKASAIPVPLSSGVEEFGQGYDALKLRAWSTPGFPSK